MRKLIFLLIFTSKICLSQNAVLDTNHILIGEQTNLTISNSLEETNVWPTYNDTIITGIEIIKNTKIDTSRNRLSQTFTITAWDSGSYYIPPISFSEHYRTIGLSLKVSNVILEEGGEMKDIKEPMQAPIGWSEIWPWLVIIFIAIISILIIKKYILNNKQENKKTTPKIIIAEDVIALSKLREIEKAQIWESGNIKEYHTEISEIIRTYIEKRFKFIALELTTSEIIKKLNTIISKNLRNDIEILLERADLAKFAKNKPTNAENTESMKLAKDFILSTMKKKDE